MSSHQKVDRLSMSFSLQSCFWLFHSVPFLSTFVQVFLFLCAFLSHIKFKNNNSNDISLKSKTKNSEICQSIPVFCKPDLAQEGCHRCQHWVQLVPRLQFLQSWWGPSWAGRPSTWQRRWASDQWGIDHRGPTVHASSTLPPSREYTDEVLTLWSTTSNVLGSSFQSTAAEATTQWRKRCRRWQNWSRPSGLGHLAWSRRPVDSMYHANEGLTEEASQTVISECLRVSGAHCVWTSHCKQTIQRCVCVQVTTAFFDRYFEASTGNCMSSTVACSNAQLTMESKLFNCVQCSLQ